MIFHKRRWSLVVIILIIITGLASVLRLLPDVPVPVDEREPPDLNQDFKQSKVTDPARPDVAQVTPWLAAPIVWDNTYDSALLDAIYKPRNITIATTVFAVGKYTRFLRDFLESAERHYFVGFNVRYYVFTDKPDEVPSVEMGAGREVMVRSVAARDRWQDISAGRMREIQTLIQELQGQQGHADFIFCLDVDMKFYAHWGTESLGELVAGLHPAFYRRERSAFNYERRPESKAYMAPDQGDFYYQACIFGGDLPSVHHLVTTCADNIEFDGQQNIEALWQDESHFNRYLFLFKPTKVLSPEYLWMDQSPIGDVIKIKRFSSVVKNNAELQMSSGVYLDPPVGQHAMELPPETQSGNWADNNSLLFMFEFHPGPGPPQPSSDDGFVGTGPDLEVMLPARCNVRTLRLRLCMQAQEQNWLPDPLGLLDPEEYILLYARGQDWYEVYDDYQIVRTLDIPWSRDASGRMMARIVVMQPSAVDLKERREQQKGLVQLIGHDLDSEASDRLGELTFTRRKLASSRRLELNSRDEKAYATEPWTTSFPIPKDLQAHLSRKLPVTLHHLNRISFTVKVDLTATPNILLKVFQQVMADQGLDCDPLDGLVLKVSGREEFLTGDLSLSDFLWVRQCMKSNQEVHLSVVPMAQLVNEGPKVIDWPLVDSFTGQSSSHEDLRLEGKDLDDVFMISLWDCDRRFRVKLLGFDIPKPPNKVPQSAYVEVSILLGNKVLSTVVSSPKAFADEVLWNEWLEFDMLLRDLPRGTKLGLTINTNDSNGAARESKTLSSGPNKAPDCQQKGKGKVLYFVNLLLIDHRSLLSQGPHTLHMWPYPELEEEAFTYPADKLSSATNPDITNSMAITFLLDRYNFPVVLPTRTTTPVAFTSPPPSPEHISSMLAGSATEASSIDLARSSSSAASPDTSLSTTKPTCATSSAGSGQFSPAPPATSPPLPAGSPLCAPASQHSTLASSPLSDGISPSPPVLPLKRRSYAPSSTTTLSSSEDSNLSSSRNSLPTGLSGAHSPASTVEAAQPSTSSKYLSADPPQMQTLRSHSPVTATNRSPLRRFREESFRYTSNLPQFLRSIDWVKRDVVDDVHWLLGNWEPKELDLSVALELLGVDFIDERVRRLAVQRLEILSNDEVLMYLLQLVQILKVEPYHDSFLARYLIRRALRSKRIGHFFFWYVRSEVAGCPYFRQRMAVVLEAYLLGCGKAMLDGFVEQVQAVRALEVVAWQIKQLFPLDLPATAATKLQDLLRNSDLPSEFLVPFDPRIRAGRILLDKCKVMPSKKKPLWLEFSPMPSPISTTPDVGIIFKLGDDLRQDMLVIQTLMVMDSIWQESSLDLCLVPYGCISTGQNIGMLEIVRDAETIATVQKSQGGSTAAFANDALFQWLKDKCPFKEINCHSVERFVNSCAGYCVATYVLGIGDRHNDNIMITDQGNLFHIDFGHILGHRKSFLGVNRERVPFVLTPDFLYVMGRVKGRTSLYFQRFRDTCTQAYLLLRSHSRMLVTLFSLMLLTGIPKLSCAEDMSYLREALQEDHAEEVARKHFLQQIALCEQLGWTVQANWWIHMVAGIK